MRFRLRARFGRLRRYHKVVGVVGVVGVVIAVVSIALAVFTMRWSFMLAGHSRLVSVSGGAVFVIWDYRLIESILFRIDIGQRSVYPWDWLPSSRDVTAPGGSILLYRQVALPLWMFLALGLGLAAPALLSMRQMRFGNLCPACDYDRTGLPDDTPCPECGKSR